MATAKEDSTVYKFAPIKYTRNVKLVLKVITLRYVVLLPHHNAMHGLQTVVRYTIKYIIHAFDFIIIIMLLRNMQ